MFACIYGRSVSADQELPANDTENFQPLVDLAFTFSPLIEQTTANTVVLDISGQDLLFGTPQPDASSVDEIQAARNVAVEIASRAQALKLNVNIAVAADPDVAIHAARTVKGVKVIARGEELSTLGTVSIKNLDCSLLQIDRKRAAEIQETFALWGIRSFRDLARLPLSGVAERLGQDGVRLQKLAQGTTDRKLNLLRPPIGFSQSIELEHPVSEVEPLSFILSRLLNQLCANLHEYALAANELKLRIVLDKYAADRDEVKASEALYECALTLPVPMCNPKTLLRLLLFEIEREPPPAPVMAVTIDAEPVKPRAAQTGLFVPLAPQPEKLEITLARLAKLVGAENVGSPEILDTHRPDTFRMKQFRVNYKSLRNAKKDRQADRSKITMPRNPVMGFRVFRPAWHADVQTREGKPIRIQARSQQMSGQVRGEIMCAAGPWRASGDWWRPDVWARDEWDIAVIDRRTKQNEVLCRIYFDLTSEQWFVAGIYD